MPNNSVRNSLEMSLWTEISEPPLSSCPYCSSSFPQSGRKASHPFPRGHFLESFWRWFLSMVPDKRSWVSAVSALPPCAEEHMELLVLPTKASPCLSKSHSPWQGCSPSLEWDCFSSQKVGCSACTLFSPTLSDLDSALGLHSFAEGNCLFLSGLGAATL